ncbi:Uncharacterized protein SCF082_LOCUS42902 [Durusdinium trenchii]|uniref:Uncharacterized protein n=1 Tax=Durusdinium trenchii TaxID=1381693 RepID=A0ABP0QU17_9DINO
MSKRPRSDGESEDDFIDWLDFVRSLVVSDPGPVNYQELLHWPGVVLTRLANVDMLDILEEKFSSGIEITTSYSGVGSPETALGFLQQALGRYGCETGTLKVHSATEYSKHCQRILANHVDGPSKAECIFSDLRAVVPDEVIQNMRAVRQAYLKRYTYQVHSNKVPAAMAIKRLGVDFVRHVWPDFMRAAISPTAFCLCHNKACLTGTSQNRSGVLRGNTAGFTCVDWSNLGNQLGWLGESAETFLSCLADQLVNHKPDFILGECVEGFDTDMLGELTKDWYTLLPLSISPEMFGFPATRKRLYMILLRKGVLSWHRQVQRGDPASLFFTLFSRPLSLCGEVYFNAPPEYVARFHAEWAKSKHLPELQADGKCRQHAKVDRAEKPFFVMNTTQSCPFQEMLIDPEQPDLWRDPLPQLRSMAGNGMHIGEIRLLCPHLLARQGNSGASSNGQGKRQKTKKEENDPVEEKTKKCKRCKKGRPVSEFFQGHGNCKGCSKDLKNLENQAKAAKELEWFRSLNDQQLDSLVVAYNKEKLKAEKERRRVKFNMTTYKVRVLSASGVRREARRRLMTEDAFIEFAQTPQGGNLTKSQAERKWQEYKDDPYLVAEGEGKDMKLPIHYTTDIVDYDDVASQREIEQQQKNVRLSSSRS